MRIKPEQIEAWISKNFPGYKRRSNGRQLSINNPFDGDTGHNLWISLEETVNKHNKYRSYYVHDWRHNRDNCSFINFVRKYKNCSFYQAVSEVCQNAGFVRSHFYDKPVEEEVLKQIELPKSSRPFDEELTIAGDLALRYLNSRAITKEQAIRHGLYYTCTTFVFPYYEFGVIEYCQEREILNKVFHNPSEKDYGVSKTDFLYNFDNAECPGGTLILVESIIDSINVGDDCLATGGAKMSEGGKQVDKLRMLNPKMIILAPDNDKAGRESLASNFVAIRSLRCKVGYCLPSNSDEKSDWNDIEKSGVGKARSYIVNNSCELSLSRAIRLRG
jgi:hypothetical protein